MQQTPTTTTQLPILQTMLSTPFPGQDALLSQLHGLTTVDTGDTDNYGSIYLFPVVTNRAHSNLRVPVEARTHDTDGVEVLILLHVVDGLLHELEIVKMDGTPLRSEIKADELEVQIN